MTKPVLQVENLHKSFKTVKAVDDLSFVLNKGECLALLGANGAGKTTTIKMLYGFQTPDQGSISYFGQNFFENKYELKAFIGVCSQEDNLDSDFTVRQNLEIFASYFYLSVDSIKSHIERLLTLVDLKDKENSSIHELSGGMKKRLQLIKAMIHQPRVLFLDEPTTGLDPEARREVWEFINKIKIQDGVAVILTTHYMDEAEKLSDNILLMQKGKKVLEGAWSELKKTNFEDKILTSTLNEKIEVWAKLHKINFIKSLNEMHLDISKIKRDEFLIAFPDVNFTIRQPNLEDLYLKTTGNLLN